MAVELTLITVHSCQYLTNWTKHVDRKASRFVRNRKYWQSKHSNIVTIAVNPKEYFKKYRDKSFNKKDKGLKKDTPGMYSEAYANRVMSLSNFTNQKTKNIQQNRF